MKYIISILFLIIGLNSFSQTTVTRDTIRIPGTDSTTVVVNTKTTTILSGTVSYTYPSSTTTTTYYKVANGSTPVNLPPTASAGGSQTITLPVNSITLSGTASDSDGTIVNVLWSKTSGGSALIVSPTTLNTSVNNLTVGNYTFRLTVTDNGGATATSSVNITVNNIVPPQDTTGIKLEGFGSQAVGGSNSSTVINVTNKAQFDAAIGSNRTIKFTADASFTGRYDLINISYLTIDGNGFNVIINNNNNADGISFDGSNTHHCILKNIHVTNAGNDGINVIDGSHDILITNCSSYGNRDGNIDVAGGNNVTVQYCIIGNGASGWAGDMLITATNVSVHHNLFSPVTSGQVGERVPFVHSNYTPVGNPCADIRNNLVWQWGRSGGTGSGYATAIGYNATGNVVNNYYYDKESAGSAIANGDGYGTAATGKIYSAGNVISNGTSLLSPTLANNHAEYTIPAQYQVAQQDACSAARSVLQKTGPQGNGRNATDLTYINAVSLPGCN
jgi:hypothetical protein